MHYNVYGVFFVTLFSTTCFGSYCGNLQGDVVV